MSDRQKDILNALIFMIGIIGFLSGEFIIASALFAATTVASNININRKNRIMQNQSRMRM